MRTVTARLAARSRRTEAGCLEFSGDRNSAGYGRIKVGGRRVLAHRAAWSDVNGEIPPGVVVRHRCDNRQCVAIGHLEAGSQSDNVQDMLNRGRANPPRGVRNGQAKLTDEQVEAIRQLWPGSGRTQRSIAEEFGITQPLVSAIAHGHRQKGVC